MEDLKKWVKEQCRELQYIKWVAEHIDLYSAVGGGQEILSNIQRYGRNIYTYPQEAMRAYEELAGHMQRNPYCYMVSFGGASDKDIYATSVDGYLIEVCGVLLPVGFLKAEGGQHGDEMEAIIKKALGEYLNQFQQEEKPYIQAVKKGINEYGKQAEDTKNRVDSKDSAIYMGLFLETALAVCIILFAVICLGRGMGIGQVRMGVGVGAAIGIFRLTKTLKGIAVLKRVKEVSKKKADLDRYYVEYEEMKKQYFTVTNVYYSDPPGSITPLKRGEECQGVLQDIQGITSSDDKQMSGNIAFRGWNLALLMICFIYISVAVFNAGYRGAGQYPAEVGKVETEPAQMEEEEENIPQEEQADAEEESILEGQDTIFDNNGFIFSDSNVRRLSEKELYQLQDAEGYEFKTLLGFARNEIYARLGYAFREDGTYYPYYMEYEWYRNMPHSSIDDNDLNEYELANRDLILGIEQKEGFRD